MSEEKAKRWMYKVEVGFGNDRVTYMYNKDDVDYIRNNEHDLTVFLKNATWYAFNKRHVVTWRLIEVVE
jgi:hypothetical protein